MDKEMREMTTAALHEARTRTEELMKTTFTKSQELLFNYAFASGMAAATKLHRTIKEQAIVAAQGK